MSRIVVYSVQEDELPSAHLAEALESEGFRTALLDVRDAHFAPDPDSPIIIYWSERTVLSPARAQLAELIGNVGEQPLCLVKEASLDLPASLAHLRHFPLPFERLNGEVDTDALSPIARFLRGELPVNSDQSAINQAEICEPSMTPPLPAGSAAKTGLIDTQGSTEPAGPALISDEAADLQPSEPQIAAPLINARQSMPVADQVAASSGSESELRAFDQNPPARPFFVTPLDAEAKARIANLGPKAGEVEIPAKSDPMPSAPPSPLSTRSEESDDQNRSDSLRTTSANLQEHRPSRIYPLLRGIAALLAIVAGLAILVQMLGPQLSKPKDPQPVSADRQIIQVAESTGSLLETQSNPLATDNSTALAPIEAIAPNSDEPGTIDARAEPASNVPDTTGISSPQPFEPGLTGQVQALATIAALPGSSAANKADPTRSGVRDLSKASIKSPTESRLAAASDLAGVEALWRLRDNAKAKLALVETDLRNSQFGSPGFELFLARRGALVQHLAEIDDALSRSTTPISTR